MKPAKTRNQVDLSTAAAVLGRKGGSSKSAAKTRAVRENGKKGGRPRVKAAIAAVLAILGLSMACAETKTPPLCASQIAFYQSKYGTPTSTEEAKSEDGVVLDGTYTYSTFSVRFQAAVESTDTVSVGCTKTIDVTNRAAFCGTCNTVTCDGTCSANMADCTFAVPNCF